MCYFGVNRNLLYPPQDKPAEPLCYRHTLLGKISVPLQYGYVNTYSDTLIPFRFRKIHFAGQIGIHMRKNFFAFVKSEGFNILFK